METDPYRLFLTNGEVIDLPPDTDPRLIAQVREEFAEFIKPDPTTLGAIGQGLLNIPRGFAQTGALMARGAAQLVPGEGPVERATQSALETISDTYDPRYADSFISQLGQGIGSIGAFALPAVLSGGVGVPGMAAATGAGVLSGVGEQATRIDALQEAGEEVSGQDEVLASLLGGAIGATEALPVGRVVGRMGRQFARGAASGVARETLKDAVEETAIRSALKTGLAEGIQETTAGLGQNIVARTIYNPEAEIAPSMSEFTVGGTAGALFDLVGSAASRRAGRRMGAADWAGEDAIRTFDKIRNASIRADEALADEAAAAERGEQFDPETYYDRRYDIQEVQPGQFVVTDETGQALSEPTSFRDAETTLANMTDEDVDRLLAAEAIQMSRDQGLEASPEAVQNIYLSLLPETREIPLTTIAAILEGDGTGAPSEVLKDPRSQVGVAAFRRGFTNAERETLDEAQGDLRVATAALAEAEARTPTARARTSREGELALKPTRTKKSGGSYTLTTGEGTQYRITKYGSLGWRVSPESSPTSVLTYGRTLDEATQKAHDWQTELNKEAAATTREAQSRYINRLTRERNKALASASAKVDKLARNVASDPKSQPDFDLLAQMGAEGRSSVTPQEARALFGEDTESYDQLLYAMSGMMTQTRRNLIRGLRQPEARTKDGKPKARPKNDHLAVLEDIATRWNEGAASLKNGQIPDVTPATNVTPDMINYALRAQGWQTTGQKTGLYGWVSQILGREVTTMADLTAGERAYVLTHAASLEQGNIANPIPLPDPTPRKRGADGAAYSNEDITHALNMVRAAQAEEKRAVSRPSLVQNLVQERGLTTEQGGQIIDNLLRSGRIRTATAKEPGGIGIGLRFVSEDPVLSTQTVSDRRLENIAQRLAERSGRDAPTVGQLAMAEEIELAALQINQTLGAQAEAAAAAQNGRVDPVQAKAEIEAAMDRLIEGAADIDLIQNRITEIITNQLGLNLTEEQRANFEVIVARDAQEMARALGVEAVNDGAAGAYVSTPGSPVRIAFNLAAIQDVENKSLRQIVQELEPTAVWETTRLFFDNDFFTQPEKRALRLAAGKLTVSQGPNEGMTYEAQARQDLAASGRSPTDVGYDEQVTETATAAMAEDFRFKKLNAITSPVARSGLGKVFSFMRSMADLVKDPSVNQTLDLLGQITGGNIGARGAGFSALNPDPDAPIRAMRATAMRGGPEAVQAELARGIGPPPDASGAQVAAEAAPVADALATEPTAAVEGMSPDERQALEDERDASIERDLAAKIVPKFGPNASAEAVKAYNESAPTGTNVEARPDVRYRLSRAGESADPWGGRYTSSVAYVQPDLTLGEIILNKVKSFQFYDLFAGPDAKAHFDAMRKAGRIALLDGRYEAEVLDEMFGSLVRDEEGIEVLADQEAATMLRRADQVAQIFAESIKGGFVQYVQGTRDADNQFVPSTDPNAGHFVINREGFTTSSGRKFNSLLEVFDHMFREGGAGDVHVDNYMIAKRMLEIQKTAEWAQAELAKGNLGDIDEITRMQGWVTLADGPFPGGKSMEEAANQVAETEADPSMQWIVESAEGLIAWNDSLLQMAHDSGLIGADQLQAWKGRAYVSFQKKLAPDAYDIATGKKKARTGMDATRTVNIKDRLLGNSDEQIEKPLIERVMEDSSSMIHDAMINTGYNRVVRNLTELGMGQPASGRLKGHRYIRYYVDGDEQLFDIDVAKYPEAESLIKAMEFSGEDFITGMVKALPLFSDILRQGVTRMPDFMIRNLFKDSLSVAVTAGAGRPLYGTFSRFGTSAANQLMGVEDPDFKLAQQLGIALEIAGVNDRNRYETRIRQALGDAKAGELRGEGEYSPANLILKGWNAMGDLSRLSDTATRMEIYHEVLAATGNEAEAVKQSLEIINYGRRGANPVWRLVTASVPFLNARMQGLDVLYRAGTGKYTAHRLTPEGKRKAANDIMRGALTRGLMLTGITAAYYLMVNDEDWYKNLRDEVKDDYWLIPTGGDVAFKIPAPFEVGLLFKTLPEMMMRVMNEEGYDGEQAGVAMRRAALQSTMFNPVPQLMAPMFDIMRNYNSFTRSEIVPTYMEEGLPYQERRTNSTSSTAQLLAATASAIPGIPDVDPMRMEYLVNGYLGTAGNFVMSLLDNLTHQQGVRDIFNAIPLVDEVPDRLSDDVVGTRADFRVAANLPLIGAVTQDLRRGGGYQQDFYELRREVDSAVAAINRAKEEGRELDFRSYQNEYAALLDAKSQVRRLDRYMARWRERQSRVLQSDSMSEGEKRTKLRELEAERDEQLAIVPFLRETAGSN